MFSKTSKFLVLALVGISIGSFWYFKYQKNQFPVITIHSYQEAEPILPFLDSNALVLFDLDETVLTHTDVLARGRIPWWAKIIMYIRFPQLIKTSNWRKVRDAMWTMDPQIIVDPKIISMLDQLKQNNIKTFGFTYGRTGVFGNVSNALAWRYQSLKNLNIEFDKSYPNFTFTQLPQSHHSYPEFYKGILLTNHLSKDVVLAAFLDHFNLRPSRIVFFDDMLKNLNAVGNLCQQRKIACTLIHFRGVDRLPQKFNLWQSLQQIKILRDENRWVSDSQLA